MVWVYFQLGKKMSKTQPNSTKELPNENKDAAFIVNRLV